MVESWNGLRAGPGSSRACVTEWVLDERAVAGVVSTGDEQTNDICSGGTVLVLRALHSRCTTFFVRVRFCFPRVGAVSFLASEDQ
eukprot:5490732-Pleurochrysis_carterae.AAC.2